MAVTLGTNCGFVATAPVADPSSGFTLQVDNAANVFRDTSPPTAIKITEIGWWCDTASSAANFQVALYAANGAVVPGEAGTRLFLSSSTAKGTSAGWKAITGLNWGISSNTNYWLGLTLASTSPSTFIDGLGTGGAGYDARYFFNSLPNPFGGGALSNPAGLMAIYAVWEAAPPVTGNMLLMFD